MNFKLACFKNVRDDVNLELNKIVFWQMLGRSILDSNLSVIEWAELLVLRLVALMAVNCASWLFVLVTDDCWKHSVLCLLWQCSNVAASCISS